MFEQNKLCNPIANIRTVWLRLSGFSRSMKTTVSSDDLRGAAVSEPVVTRTCIGSQKPTCDLVQLVNDAVELRKSVGDGLNDFEFTFLLHRKLPAPADGFSILSFSDGSIILNVPEQDLAKWFSETAWIEPAKEEEARAIAVRYGLNLCEPPDKLSYIVPSPQAHHHLELITRWETVVVAHPLYLKIRLFSVGTDNRVIWTPKTSLPPIAPLTADLVSLYK